MDPHVSDNPLDSSRYALYVTLLAEDFVYLAEHLKLKLQNAFFISGFYTSWMFSDSEIFYEVVYDMQVKFPLYALTK